MMRGMTVLWAVLAAAVGVGLFMLKYEVQTLEDRLAGLNRDIYRNQESIHVLKAEWSYLNDPTRLRDLSERLLSMRVVKPSQVALIESLPKADRSGQPTMMPAGDTKPATADKKASPTPTVKTPAEPSLKEPARPAKSPPRTRTAEAPARTPTPAAVAAAKAPAPAPGTVKVIKSPALIEAELASARATQ